MMPALRKVCTLVAPAAALAFVFAASTSAEEPIIPPSIAKISPAGMQRGTTATFTIEGRNLSDADEVIFDAPGMIGKVMLEQRDQVAIDQIQSARDLKEMEGVAGISRPRRRLFPGGGSQARSL